MDQSKIINVMLVDGTIVEGLLEMTFEVNGDEYVIYSIEDVAYGAKVREDDTLVQIDKDEWPLVEKIFNEYMENLDENI